jgi:hypothetical protein
VQAKQVKLFAAAVASVLLAACGRADGVELEPLPPLERPTAEARAGLPLVAGVWRFAGWEVASAELGAAIGSPPNPGDLVVETQRMDSIAGFLARGEARIPLIGEVRRDSIVALVGMTEAATQHFAAGRVRADTLWLELSTLPAGELSPPTVRWAFVRQAAVGQPFFRLPTGELLRDTVVAAPPPPAPREPGPEIAPEPRQPRVAPQAPQEQAPTPRLEPVQPAQPPPPGPEVDIPPAAR